MSSFQSKAFFAMLRLGRLKKPDIPAVPKSTPPPKRWAKRLEQYTFKDIRVHRLKHQQAAKTIRNVVFFHGGGYVNGIENSQWAMVGEFSRLLGPDTEVSVIEYPLAQNMTAAQTVPLITDVYLDLIGRVGAGVETVVVGESAGAGLALAVIQQVLTLKKPLPKGLFLFWPFLDVSLEDKPMPEVYKRDILCSRDQLIKVGKMYAGDLDLKHPYCSPAFGPVEGLCPIFLFPAGRDQLHIQAMKFRERLEKAGVSVKCHEFKEMLHVWMYFPLPETKQAYELFQKEVTVLK